MTPEEQKEAYASLSGENETLTTSIETLTGERNEARGHTVEANKKYNNLYNETFKAKVTKEKTNTTQVKSFDDLGIK